jgi:hypothetical protein
MDNLTSAKFENVEKKVDTIINSKWMTYTPQIKSFNGTDPTLGSGFICKGIYKKEPNSCKVKIFINSGTGGSAGVGHYTFTLPDGILIDTNLIEVDPVMTKYVQGSLVSCSEISQGFGNCFMAGTTFGSANIIVASASSLSIIASATGTGTVPQIKVVGSEWYSVAGSDVSYSLEAELPIL